MLIRRARRSLLADRRGASLIEFAISAPVLILLMLGMIDTVPALVAKFKTRHAAESLGDVASSYTQLQASDMANVYASAIQVLAPLPSAPLIVRISNIYGDGNGHAKVYWSCGQTGLAPLVANSTVTSTPTGDPVGNFVLTTNNNASANGTNTSFIMVESQYSYTSTAHYIITTPMLMTNTTYLQPRNASYIGFPWDGNSSDAPTAPASTTKTGSLTLSNGATCNYAT